MFLQSHENALAAVVQLNGNKLLPDLVQIVKQYLDEPQIVQITKDEYFTYLTPEGELYDKSVLPELVYVDTFLITFIKFFLFNF